MRVLLLGGTADARALAEALADRTDLEVVTSRAGRTERPRSVAGTVRVGGFGGADGLAAYLREEAISAVVDATHPFAVRITRHAVTACLQVGVPLLLLARPGWTAAPGDDWIHVPDLEAAARTVAGLPAGTVLLTLGRSGASAFADDPHHYYVVRSVEPPTDPLPARRTLLLDRGPFTLDTERELFRRHHVGALVTRDSGADWTAAKLTAARENRLPVVMIDRPPLPEGIPTAASVADVEAWLDSGLRLGLSGGCARGSG